jgi:hypothetical protein
VLLTGILDFSSRRAAKAVNKRGRHRYDLPLAAGEVEENGLARRIEDNVSEASGR